MEGNFSFIIAHLKVHCKARSRKIRVSWLTAKDGNSRCSLCDCIRLGTCIQPAWLVGTHLQSLPIPLAHSFTSVCFGQLPHFALTVWFSKNKEEMGKEICVQHGYREMCLEVRVFGAKWWLPGGQPVSAQLGKRTNGKNKCIDGTPTEMVSKGETQKKP